MHRIAVQVLDSDDVHFNIRRVQQIVTLLEGYPQERARRAAERALHFRSLAYGAIQKMLLKGLDLRKEEAVSDSLSHSEFLLRLCADEVERRESKQLEMRRRRANFDGQKRLDDFDWTFNPAIPKAKLGGDRAYPTRWRAGAFRQMEHVIWLAPGPWTVGPPETAPDLFDPVTFDVVQPEEDGASVAVDVSAGG